MAVKQGYITIGYADAIPVTASQNIPIILDDTQTLATLVTDVIAIATDAIALSLDAVTGVTFTIQLDSPTRADPLTGATTEKSLLMNMNVLGSQYPQEELVPGMDPALLVNQKIDLTNAALTTFVSDLVTPGHVQGCDKDGKVLVSLLDAAQTFRGNKRQSLKKTRSRA